MGRGERRLEGFGDVLEEVFGAGPGQIEGGEVGE